MRMMLAFLLAAVLARSAAAQTPEEIERRAFRLSLWGTLVPVTAGTILWARQASDAWSSEGPDRTGAAFLVAGGLTFGPWLGYSSAGLGGRGARGVGIRLGLTLLSIGSAYGICGWDCGKGDVAYEVAWAALATGTGLGAASAIYDIARLRHNVRRHQARAEERVSVTPMYTPGSRRVGVLVAVTF